MGNRSAADTEALRLEKLETMCCDLRRTGLTLSEIANALGLSDASIVHEAIKRAKKKARALTVESAQDLVDWETERLDVYLTAIWPKVQKGDLKAIDRALKIGAARRALYGLDAPTKVEHSEAPPERATAATARKIMSELFPGDVTPGHTKPDEETDEVD